MRNKFLKGLRAVVLYEYTCRRNKLLGQRVVKRFLEEKYDVTCLSRSEETKNKLFKLKEKYNGNFKYS